MVWVCISSAAHDPKISSCFKDLMRAVLVDVKKYCPWILLNCAGVTQEASESGCLPCPQTPALGNGWAVLLLFYPHEYHCLLCYYPWRQIAPLGSNLLHPHTDVQSSPDDLHAKQLPKKWMPGHCLICRCLWCWHIKQNETNPTQASQLSRKLCNLLQVPVYSLHYCQQTHGCPQSCRTTEPLESTA